MEFHCYQCEDDERIVEKDGKNFCENCNRYEEEILKAFEGEDKGGKSDFNARFAKINEKTAKPKDRGEA